MPLIPIALGVAALGAFGYTIDKTGEGINDASNGLVKIALAGAAIYFVAKKTKVI